MNNNIDSINDLNNSKDEQLKKLHQLVEDAIKEEKLIVDQLQHRQKKFYPLDSNFPTGLLYLAAVGNLLFYAGLF